MNYSPANFIPVAAQELVKVEERTFLQMVAGVFNYLCDTAMNSYGDSIAQNEARQLGGQIRSHSLSALKPLLEQFEQNAIENGIKVLWAEDGGEACQLVSELITKHQVKVITKGKSMLSEEIGLNHYLEANNGVKIYEGDLGELIVQQRGTMPYHIVGPAINLKVQEIASILQEHIAMPYTEVASEIANYVRGFMREQFEGSQMGITGVNQAVAATGSMLLVENEGNIRWVTSAPRVHVALMSIEKVCADMNDALHLLGLLTRNCTGQAITSYVSVLNGPRRADEEDGPDAMYVIIVDNGRSKAYQDLELKEALRCIRCGRCGIQCPIYMRVGAYPYGNCYPGPMGNVLMPLVMGVDSTHDLYEACTLCGACQAVCPSRLPHLDLYLRYRQMKAEQDKAAGTNAGTRMAFKLWGIGVQKPALYKTGMKAVRRYLRGAGKDGYITKLRGPAAGWFEERDLPVPEGKSFRERWQEGLGTAAAQVYAQAAATKEGGQ